MTQAFEWARIFSLSTPRPPAVVCTIRERPGRCQDTTKQTALQRDLDTVACSASAGPLDYGVFSDDPDRFRNRLIAFAHDALTHEPVGFVAMPLLEIHLNGTRTQLAHLGLAMVDERRQCTGIVSLLYGLCGLYLLARNRGRPMWISNVSQIPRVIGAVCEHFDCVYPGPAPSTVASPEHRSIADTLMRSHRATFGVAEEAGFDPERFVITDAYTGGSDALKKPYTSDIEHSDARYNAFCRDWLDYDRGDDFLQIGRVSIFTVARFVAHGVHRCLGSRTRSILEPLGRVSRMRGASF